ncbi:hypothetical protein THAOC_01322, partial [Thalassiosira oceanica]
MRAVFYPVPTSAGSPFAGDRGVGTLPLALGSALRRAGRKGHQRASPGWAIRDRDLMSQSSTGRIPGGYFRNGPLGKPIRRSLHGHSWSTQAPNKNGAGLSYFGRRGPSPPGAIQTEGTINRNTNRDVFEPNARSPAHEAQEDISSVRSAAEVAVVDLHHQSTGIKGSRLVQRRSLPRPVREARARLRGPSPTLGGIKGDDRKEGGERFCQTMDDQSYDRDEYETDTDASSSDYDTDRDGSGSDTGPGCDGDDGPDDELRYSLVVRLLSAVDLPPSLSPSVPLCPWFRLGLVEDLGEALDGVSEERRRARAREESGREERGRRTLMPRSQGEDEEEEEDGAEGGDPARLAAAAGLNTTARLLAGLPPVRSGRRPT